MDIGYVVLALGITALGEYNKSPIFTLIGGISFMAIGFMNVSDGFIALGTIGLGLYLFAKTFIGGVK